jgi:hypothetical protein
MSRIARNSHPVLLLAILALVAFADDKPAPSYNETGSVLSTIDKHGHFYQVATDSKIYLLMCTKVKSIQFGSPECKIGDKPIAAGDTVHFRIEGDWAYMAPISEGTEEKLRILTTELKNIPPLPPAPAAENEKNAKTTPESGVVIGTGMQVRGQHGVGWSTTPTAINVPTPSAVASPITTASAATPVMPTAPVMATPVTGGPPVPVVAVAPTSGGVVTGVPVTGGAPITAVPVAPVTGVPIGGPPPMAGAPAGAPAGGGMVMMGGGAPQWVHVLRIQTAGKIYQLECSTKPCKIANKEIALGDSLSFRVDKKWAYMSVGAQASTPATTDEEQKYRILSVTEVAPPPTPAPKPQ